MASRRLRRTRRLLALAVGSFASTSLESEVEEARTRGGGERGGGGGIACSLVSR